MHSCQGPWTCPDGFGAVSEALSHSLRVKATGETLSVVLCNIYGTFFHGYSILCVFYESSVSANLVHHSPFQTPREICFAKEKAQEVPRLRVSLFVSRFNLSVGCCGAFLMVRWALFGDQSVTRVLSRSTQLQQNTLNSECFLYSLARMDAKNQQLHRGKHPAMFPVVQCLMCACVLWVSPSVEDWKSTRNRLSL